MSYNLTDYETLELKQDYQETVKRYEAFWNGDIIDRPIVNVFAPNPDYGDTSWYLDDYYARMNDDLDELVGHIVGNVCKTKYMGEAVPQAFVSFGCDELAAFCGGETLYFSGDNHSTNWSKPFVEDWETVMPLSAKKDTPLWLRMQEFLDKCAEAMQGKMFFTPLDLHSNLDLLSAMRGGEKLCLDLIDRPEVIDKALEQSMEIFEYFYNETFKKYNLPAANGITLQCDFSCMLSTSMFRRFALPYLEREAEYNNGRTLYHWDGVNALTHTDDLIASKGLYALSFVPGTGNGEHTDFLDLYAKIQKGGKAVCVNGNQDQIKYMHKYLKPNKTIYHTSASSVQEAEELLDWFKKNTYSRLRN
ncbi:MAG: hypothetical protein FWH48_04130 [Oscillospiraceae bacterium]|nr:hypothetical protein [Oscillospiraceae bacterium]